MGIKDNIEEIFNRAFARANRTIEIAILDKEFRAKYKFVRYI